MTTAPPGSALAELLAYVRERVAKVRIALLVFLVAGLDFLVEPAVDAAQALPRIALVALLIVQFRLWDDLADREHDRLRHPERVLARHGGHATLFYAVLSILSVPIVGLLFTLANPAWRIVLYGALALAVAVVYGSQVTAHGRVMRMGWVLLKYPVFVVLPLAAPTAPNALVAAAVAYLVVMLYDWATSPDAVDLRSAYQRFPDPTMFERVGCNACGSADSVPFVNAEDDLTGRPGLFVFVRCRNCRLAYQDPRLKPEHLREYPGGDLLSAGARARYEHNKAALVERFARIGTGANALDVKPDESGQPFHERPFGERRFDLITMWSSLQRERDAPRALHAARDLLAEGGRLMIETPRLDSATWKLYRERWPGLDAPRHTVLFTRQSLQMMVEAAGLEVVAYLPYGALPAYSYLFAGAAFKVLKGRGLDLQRARAAYVLGRVLLFPVVMLERRLDLAMQVVVCRRPVLPLPWERVS